MIGAPMDLVTALALGAALGVVVGVVFFGGLAWTVSRLADARMPGRLVMASLAVRMGVAALGAWAAATVAGFAAVIALAVTAIGMRTVVVRRMTPDVPKGG